MVSVFCLSFAFRIAPLWSEFFAAALSAIIGLRRDGLSGQGPHADG